MGTFIATFMRLPHAMDQHITVINGVVVNVFSSYLSALMYTIKFKSLYIEQKYYYDYSIQWQII